MKTDIYSTFYNYINYYKQISKNNILEKISYNNYQNNNSLYNTYINRKYGFTETQANYYSYIFEGLIYTWSYNNFMHIFNNKFKTIEYILEPLKNNYVNNINPLLQLLLYKADYDNFKNNIFNFIQLAGYFISKTEKLTQENTEVYLLIIEPKYIVNASEFIYEQCNGILYHLCPLKIYKKIISQGLITKSHNKISNHPDRVYMFRSDRLNPDNDMQLKQQINSLFKNNDNTYRVNDNLLNNNHKLDIALLKIDLKQYSKLKYILFYDPNHRDAVFSNESISPNCITLYKIIEDQ